MFKQIAILFWLIPLALNAQMDPAAKAAQVARDLMGIQQTGLKSSVVQDSVIPIGSNEAPSGYIVTFKPTGFVIVSASQPGSPVLGFSVTTAFPTDPDHPLRSWLIPLYDAQAAHPVQQKSTKGALYSTDHIVLPLISAEWGQGSPWNRYCPVDNSGKNALVGCVAVAMSQIMEKWRWPLKGVGEVTYTPLQHSEYGEITVNFDTTHYRWDLTHDIYSTEASSLILYHAGVSSLMNYDPVLSTTSVDRYAITALIHNFSYNSSMDFKEMEASTLDEWIRMLHQELDNSRPVLYAGTSPNGKSSHAFNVDGYRNDNYFHFNWGWNGAGDGWYTLAGMAGGGSDFSSQQGAIFGIQPKNMPLHDRPSSLDVLSGDNFVQLFWDKPVITDFSHFIIYRDGVIIGQTGDTKYRDEGVTNDTTYTYSVTAWYQGENSGESAATPSVTAIPWTRVIPGYKQTFEFGTEGWQIKDSISGFRIGTASGFDIGGNTGKVASIRSEGHDAGEQVTDYLTSPVIYPGNTAYLAVSFEYMFRQNPGVDKLYLMWRDFTTGTWQPIAVLDSTGGYSDWKTLHFYLPQTTADNPVQIAFYYNDFFGQGYGAAIDNLTFYEVAQPAVPGIATDLTDLCLGQTVTYSDESKGTIQSWNWDFGEGAEPRYATTKGPHQVIYTKSGAKTVKLSLNHLDHLQISNMVSIRDKPVAAIEYTRKFQDISFIDKSEYSESVLWLFGDGGSSTQRNPVHTYYTKNLFEVRQIASNGTCAPDTVLILVDMRNGTGIDEAESLASLSIFPNPVRNKLSLMWNNLPHNPMNIRIISITGQVFFLHEYSPAQELTLDLSDFPDGLYILQIASGKLIRNEQIIKVNN
jgi:PKD repeat protein